MTPQQNELLEQYYPLVAQVVKSLKDRFPPNTDWTEVHSWGVEGLVAAAKKAEFDRGDKFAVYAEIRIRGRISDELRKIDCLTRRGRRAAHKVDAIVDELRQQLGREPNDAEVRAKTGLSVAKFRNLLLFVRPTIHSSLDFVVGDGGDTVQDLLPDHQAVVAPEEMEKADRKESLRLALLSLSPSHLFVIQQVYFENRFCASLAAHLGVTSSRVSQMRTEALKALKKALQSQKH